MFGDAPTRSADVAHRFNAVRGREMKPADKVPPTKASIKTSITTSTALAPLEHDHALLDPGQLSGMAEEAAHDLMAEGESDNTRLAYRAAMRYWAAWFGARYGRQMALPVPVPVVACVPLISMLRCL